MREQWPVTDDKVNQTAQTGKLFCRLSQEYGQCLLTMNQRCPGYTTPENGNGWFGATWEKFMGKLCDTPFPPQRYIPVVYGQCYAQNADIVPSLVLSPTSPYVLQSISASSAQENACSAMSDMQAHMNGTAAAIARKCDQEAARVLVEGTRYLHQINCPG
ncbi:uncharacterized protein LOC129602157 isoform X2 [Paramacrobiotus metropolitanus]|nr:uncharacterized protein LOC129602157 isoform X2 [Paramacrobiotus metropolitanus]